jgi:acetyltransferase-like isoleucine patch superfamily enzyme
LELTFRNTEHHLYPLIENKECPASSLKLFGYPLIVRNIMLAQRFMSIDTICLPDEFSDASRLIQDYFPTINLKEFCDNSGYENSLTVDVPLDIDRQLAKINLSRHDSFEIPINSVIHYSSFSRDNNCDTSDSNLVVDVLTYPWDFLKAVQNVLHSEITHTVISPMATIAKSSIITGPCIIEDDVIIDDFCKIIGPLYIGSGSFIGMSSLVRKSMLGINTRIGFNCEVAKTYFEGHDRIAHQNVILDSIIGRNVWLGGYSGTANVLLDRKNVRYQIDQGLVDTGTDHFGAVIGNNCTIGASVIILPGRHIQPNSMIQAGSIVGKKPS